MLMASSRRYRDRRPARRSAFRTPKPTMLIVCEGKKSEPDYFTGLSRSVHNSRVDIQIEPASGVPLSVVETAKKLKKNAEDNSRREEDENIAYDTVWCVFDVDDHPNVPGALQLAADAAISVALSNPSFELWLLLHFRESPGMQHRSKVVELLKGFVPDYDKKVDFTKYEVGCDDAVRRAKRLHESAEEDGEVGRNPSTGVFDLAIEICKEDTSK
jgi:hypothetical protein